MQNRNEIEFFQLMTICANASIFLTGSCVFVEPLWPIQPRENVVTVRLARKRTSCLGKTPTSEKNFFLENAKQKKNNFERESIFFECRT
jgi:hypothetical protein